MPKPIKKKYIDNEEFEKLLITYKKTRDPKILEHLIIIFRKITNAVYNIAVRNIYNNISPGNFPLPNYHDKEDLIQTIMMQMLVAIDYWKPNHKMDKNFKGEKKVKSKAFNYFTCCIIYGIQNELKKELRKGWHKSVVLRKNYLVNYCMKMGLDRIPIDYDEAKKYDDGYNQM